MQEPVRKRIRIMEDEKDTSGKNDDSSEKKEEDTMDVELTKGAVPLLDEISTLAKDFSIDSQSIIYSSQETITSSQDLFEGLDDKNEPSHESEDCTLGVGLDRLPRVGVSVGSQFTPPAPSTRPPHHTVLVDLQRLTVNQVPLPYPVSPRNAWDGRHVRLPWSPDNKYPVNVGHGRKELRPRWDLISTALTKLITMEGLTTNDVKEAILSYNSRYANTFSWSFVAFESLFHEDFGEDEQDLFLKEVLPGMVRLCLQGPQAITNIIPLLKSQQSGSITMSQYQISVLLANAFFCTFPRRNSNGMDAEYSNYPDINFNRMLSMSDRRAEAQREKIKTVLAYFKQVLDSPSTGLLTFTRQVVEQFPNWADQAQTFDDSSLRLSSAGTIEEDGLGMLQVDFANKFVGGGVLGQGLVQEEIRFIICPELIASMLFTEVLEDNEVLVVHGAQQYSRYTGYSDTYRFNGRFIDTTEFDISNRRQTTIVAMDATRFNTDMAQFKEAAIRRELNKAFVGFQSTQPASDRSCLNAVATGNWGCGAFKGNPQLKLLIQLMAARVVGRKVCYFTFKDTALVRSGWEVYRLIVDHGVTVGDLYKLIIQYSRFGRNEDLLEYVTNRVLGKVINDHLDEPPAVQVQVIKGSVRVQQEETVYSVDTDDEEHIDTDHEEQTAFTDKQKQNPIQPSKGATASKVSEFDKSILNEYKDDKTGNKADVLGAPCSTQTPSPGFPPGPTEDPAGPPGCLDAIDRMEQGLRKQNKLNIEKKSQCKITDYFGKK